ncbi:AlpA family transcriptional regulator [Ahrensia sp. 13_GOM-1096m]|uniref:helix-turn-helix transcriptional regulator n=1 Tax=Ahrensia sp. 13_GOM-1096m TaxID=1380380 RepID=UPI00047A99C4|nr:hypothetical protein [Ahrensia sp. 13_GOM-1096m]
MLNERIFYSDRDLDAMGLPTRVTRWRMRRSGDFPNPVEISKGRKAYPAEAIKKWIAERMEGYSHAA